MKHKILRVALIGPESTGKSTLCKQLAAHFNTCCVTEFSREYIASLNRPYTKEDIIFCSEQQLKTEEEILPKANKIIFADTELIVARIWLLDVFGEYPDWIDKMIIEKKYDLYLLTNDDIPFVTDTVRENPNRREYFFNRYKSELEKREFRYDVVDGIGEVRLSRAIKIIENFFNN